MFEEHFARRQQPHAAWRALEQLAAELVFEAAYLS